MKKFLLGRLLNLLISFFIMSVVAFSLIRMVPGDPVTTLLGERGGSEELYHEIRHNLGLDKPLVVQYGYFVMNALQGDLGTSIITNLPVWDEFFDRFPATLELGLTAMLWAILLGIPIGVIAAVKRNSFFDYFVMGTSLTGYSMPIFWWALILIIVFSVMLGITPVSGRLSFLYDIEPQTGFMLIDTWLSEDGGFAAFKSALAHLILPAFAMGTIPLAVISRMTRSSMLEVLGEDYVRTAKAKGLRYSVVVWKHALRNASIPIVTIIGLTFGSIITGAILTETIFSWPGIGKWMVGAVMGRDYPVIQGGILLIATLIILINTAVDVSYSFLNPKVRKS